jgi:hypothetical protein
MKIIIAYTILIIGTILLTIHLPIALICFGSCGILIVQELIKSKQ